MVTAAFLVQKHSSAAFAAVSVVNFNHLMENKINSGNKNI